MNDFKIGDKVKVITQTWEFPELEGKEGIVVEISSKSNTLIQFINYTNNRLHEGNDGSFKKNSCWYFYRGGDKLIKTIKQLELF